MMGIRESLPLQLLRQHHDAEWFVLSVRELRVRAGAGGFLCVGLL
jgi:hypothetical protein